MTREEAKKLLPIIQAWADGKIIQVREKGRWVELCIDDFTRSPDMYRIKPETNYRPFKTQEECWSEMHKHPDFGWVVTKNCRVIYHIDYVYNALFINNCGYSFNEMYQKYEFTDGTPFGIKEE